ncbi:hypothetical protein GCM10009730_41590 [Streptomyces albidochromogenes]
MHEGGVEPLAEQRVEVRVALRGGDPVGRRDLREGGGRAGLQVRFEPRAGGQYRQICLLSDVSEPDDADLHGGSP